MQRLEQKKAQTNWDNNLINNILFDESVCFIISETIS